VYFEVEPGISLLILTILGEVGFSPISFQTATTKKFIESFCKGRSISINKSAFFSYCSLELQGLVANFHRMITKFNLTS
jgi:hypothetical protein